MCLRALRESDIGSMLLHWNTWELRHTIGAPLPRSRAAMEEWFVRTSKTDPWKDDEITLAITEKRSGEFLGVATLRAIRSPHNRGRIGISIYDSENRSKGYGTDATRVVLWIAFHILGLHSISLDTFPDNERAVRTYESCGFKRVGLLRKTEFMAGQHHDLLVMDILREEFMQEYPPGAFVEQSIDTS
ncbi:MAG: GNAT family N-acetyltransferase [Candidatus Thorarchaeota archaeon]|nr:MAG: GNAT family N-acetyltransferase [Candidatus Thorarchaeota archaeon]